MAHLDLTALKFFKSGTCYTLPTGVTMTTYRNDSSHKISSNRPAVMTPQHQQQQQQRVGCGVRSVDTSLTHRHACAPPCWRGCGECEGWSEKWKGERWEGEHAVVRRRHVARWGQLMHIRIQFSLVSYRLVGLHPLTLLLMSALASNCKKNSN